MAGLSGRVFGRLTVQERYMDRARPPRWICECVCGTVKPVLHTNLVSGDTKSCGCLALECDRPGRAPNHLAGRVFGRWTAKARVTPERTTKNALWECVCECGTSKPVRADLLLQGRTRSCGCMRRKAAKPVIVKVPKIVVKVERVKVIKVKAPRPPKQVIPPTGDFGLWTVKNQFRKDASGHREWLCECACGKRDYIEASALTRGRSKSCGCTLWWWPRVEAGKEWNRVNAR